MADPTPQVEWGWRIQCAHPGCEECLSEFRPSLREPNDYYYGGGPPPLPRTRYYDKATSHAGWFFQASLCREQPDHRIYRAYCPEHSGPALDWVTAMQVWRDARREIGKQKALSFYDRLKEWGARLFHGKVGQSVQEWVDENPKPEPPWKEAA